MKHHFTSLGPVRLACGTTVRLVGWSQQRRLTPEWNFPVVDLSRTLPPYGMQDDMGAKYEPSWLAVLRTGRSVLLLAIARWRITGALRCDRIRLLGSKQRALVFIFGGLAPVRVSTLVAYERRGAWRRRDPTLKAGDFPNKPFPKGILAEERRNWS